MKKYHLIYRALLLGALFVFTSGSLFSQIRIKAVGDIMLGSLTPDPVLPKDSGNFFKDYIGEALSGSDLLFGNLEGVFIKDEIEPRKCSEASRKAHRCYEFGMPANEVHILNDLGFDVVSLDNNHVSDYGYSGYKFTQDLLDKHGIAYAAKKKVCSIEKLGQRIAVVPFGTSSSSNHVANTAEAGKIIASLRDQYDLIIVSFHGGAEGARHMHVKDTTEFFYGENRGNLIRFAHTVIDSGAHLVLGHGPHVLRGVEVYKNKFIAYSMGNFLTHGNVKVSGVNGITLITELEIDTVNGDFRCGKFIPVKQIPRGIPMVDTTGRGIELVRSLSRSDFGDTNLIIQDNGEFHHLNIPIREPEPEHETVYEEDDKKPEQLVEIVKIETIPEPVVLTKKEIRRKRKAEKKAARKRKKENALQGKRNK